MNYFRSINRHSIVFVGVCIASISFAGQPPKDLLQNASDAAFLSLDYNQHMNLNDNSGDILRTKMATKAVDSLVESGRFKYAISIAERIPKVDARADAWAKIALGQRLEGDNEGAEQNLKQAISLYKKQDASWACRAILFHLRHSTSNPTKTDTKALLQFCERSTASELAEPITLEYAIAVANIGEFTKASKIAESISSKSTKIEWLMGMSKAYAKHGQAKKAQMLFSKALGEFKVLDSYERYRLSAQLVVNLLEQNKKSKALALIEEIPEYKSMIYSWLVHYYEEQNRHDETARYAELLVKEIAKSKPNSAHPYFASIIQASDRAKVIACLWTGQKKKAVQHLDRMVAEISKKEESARFELSEKIESIAGLYVKANKLDAAIQTMFLDPVGRHKIRSELFPKEIKHRILSNQLDQACQVAKKLSSYKLLAAAFDIGLAMKSKKEAPKSCVQLGEWIKIKWEESYKKK